MLPVTSTRKNTSALWIRATNETSIDCGGSRNGSSMQMSGIGGIDVSGRSVSGTSVSKSGMMVSTAASVGGGGSTSRPVREPHARTNDAAVAMAHARDEWSGPAMAQE